MIRPPPTPPLFPYTTLFRSAPAHPPHPHRSPARLPTARRRLSPPQSSSCLAPAAGPARDPALLAVRRSAAAARARTALLRPPDRKSTRLNSSHPSISYAVFC